LPERKPAIGDYGLKPIAEPLFANLLFNLLNPAKLYLRGALRFIRSHPRANLFLDQHCEV
jgi:hypothetical protein